MAVAQVIGEGDVRGKLVRRMLASCSALGASALCAACVQLSFDRETRLEPVPEGALAELVPGASDLEAALERLGPPILAWELPDQGAALAWGWYHSFGWRLKASTSDKTGVSVSFNYDSATARMHGAVLFFDGAWKLKGVREGLLSELREHTRARPSSAADDE